MATALHISDKTEGDHPFGEREAAMAAQDQVIKDALSLAEVVSERPQPWVSLSWVEFP
jgi:hypothetical protein